MLSSALKCNKTYTAVNSIIIIIIIRAGVLERLSLLHRVSIVTGRSMDTILSFLRGAFLQQQHDGGGGHDAILKRIHYAASHGFDIKGPNDTHYQVVLLAYTTTTTTLIITGW